MATKPDNKNNLRSLSKNSLRTITIVGTDTNAWFTAAYVAFSLPQARVFIVGDGSSEAVQASISTTPLLKKSFEEIGLEESHWMPASKAYYKVANLFYHWNGPVSFHHSYPSDLDTFYTKLFDSVCELRRKRSPVDANPDKYFFSSYLANKNAKPIAPYSFPFGIHYGYHADALGLIQCLREFALAKGVIEINSKVISCEVNERGEIEGLLLENNNEHYTDFYINASSKKDNIINSNMGTDHDSFGDRIINNRCLSFSSAMDKASHRGRTKCTAHDIGWLQSIPLKGRLDYNFFYSDCFTSDDLAFSQLADFLKIDEATINYNTYALDSYQTKTTWQKNCLNVGYAQCHLDPLDLDVLHFTQVTLQRFLSVIRSGAADDKAMQKYNNESQNLYKAALDYTHAHYLLASQFSSDYWRYQRDQCKIPGKVEDLFTAWLSENELPDEVISSKHSPFGRRAWQCLFAGHRHFLKADSNIACPNNYDKEIAKRNKFYEGCLKNFPGHEGNE